MSKYVIKATNLACGVRVEIENEEGEVAHHRYVYQSKDKPVVAECGAKYAFEDLPPVVQEEINNWFAVVFALPVEERGAWLESKPASSITI